MDCEICGRNCDEIFLISVEGTKLNVCSGCSHCGSFISRVDETPVRERTIVREEPETDIIDNYSSIIAQNRQKMGLSQEELAKKINENLNFIRNIEKGKLIPTEKTAKKLEKLFKIRLFQQVKKEEIKSKKAETSLSLEDVAVMK